MLYRPNSNFSSSRGDYGIVTSKGNSGPWMRRLAFPIQSNSPKQVNWRHIFMTAKQNWQALTLNDTSVQAATTERLTQDPEYTPTSTAAFSLSLFDFTPDQPIYATMQCVVNLIRTPGYTGSPLLTFSTPPSGFDIGESTSPLVTSCQLSVIQTVDPAPGSYHFVITATDGSDSATIGLLLIVTGAAIGNGTDALSASACWELVAPYYFGILEAGFALGGVEEMGRLIGCYTLEAYYNMVQNNAASLGLPPLPTPEYTTSQVQAPDPVVSQTYGSQQVQTYSAFGLQFFPNVCPCQILFSDSGGGFGMTQVTVSGMPSGVTAVWKSTGTTSFFTSGAYGFNCWDTLIVTVPSGTPAGTLPLTLSFTANGSPQTLGLDFQIINNGPQPLAIPPVFAFPNSLSCITSYGLDYVPIGFYLTYTWVEDWPVPASPWLWGPTGYAFASGALATGSWEISASDQYTNYYSPPDPSTYQPILFSSPYLPTPEALLSAWTANFGALNPSGNIKFQVCWIDTATCASGPALSCTAGWKNGTLEGAHFVADPSIEVPGGPEWQGPYFYTTNPVSGYISGGVGDNTVTMEINGFAGYGGTITFSGENSYDIPTGTPPGTNVLPTGSTITITPSTLTIAPGDTTVYTISAVFHLPDTMPVCTLNLKLKATDGIQTRSVSNSLDVNDGTGGLISTNFLGLAPALESWACPNPGSGVLLINLSNSGPNDFDVNMVAEADVPNVYMEFGAFVTGDATATDNSITFAYPNSAGANALMGQTVCSAGYSPAGYNVTDAVIVANDDLTITVAAASNPGAMTLAGQVGIMNNSVTVPAGTYASPGTASIGLYASFPGTFPSVGIQVILTAMAGTNTATGGFFFL